MDGYTIVTCIGKGSSGAVYLARSNKLKKLVAIKKIQIDESRRSRCRKSVIREANILRTLNHFHIVKCYEWFLEEEGNDISMVLEYCNGGTLQDRIANMKKNNSQIPEAKILEWTTQIASAVDYIHERKILHRDLKSENVFLLKSEVVKLGDFGISKEIDHTLDKASTCVGTPCYLSPELCQDIPYNFKSDIWALGCLVFEMCALKPAFDAANLISLFYKIVNGKYAPLPDTCSSSLKEIVSKILVRNPDERPTASQLLQLPALQTYASKIRNRTPELTTASYSPQKPKLPTNTRLNFETGDLDDLDELLNQTDKELSLRDIPNNSNKKWEAINCSRSISVHGKFGVSGLNFDDLDQENDLDSHRPQTCPHSATQREEVCTPADTIATWSGYGDRGSKRPSAVKKRYSSSDDSDDLSDFNSDCGSVTAKAVRDYSSDEFSSYSEDEDPLNTSRTAMTVDEEIPEEIEACDDTKVLSADTKTSPSLLSVSASLNLPGSAWLQSKRAQVLRQKEKPPQLLSSLSHYRTVSQTHSSENKRNNYASVRRSLPALETSTSRKLHEIKKEKLPGSSWLKSNNQKHEREIILGDPIEKTKKKKHDALPGSGWLLGKTGLNRSSSEPESQTFDYPDDFEDYDDDFEVDDDIDRTLTSTRQVSALELVRQGCIDSIGKDVFEELRQHFAKGLSVGEAYERCKGKVDFETVETCYLLKN